MKKVELEYEKFRTKQDKNYNSNFDKAVKKYFEVNTIDNKLLDV